MILSKPSKTDRHGRQSLQMPLKQAIQKIRHNMPTKARTPAQRALRRRNDPLYRQRVKQKAFRHYGSKCIRCGFSDIRSLSIDHIDGFSCLWPSKRRGTELYRWLIKRHFPKGFQLLCMNCQWIKRFENYECGGQYL